MVKKNTCVFISGQGTNLNNLISHSRNISFPIKISLVISNNKHAVGLNYAKKYNIPYIFINTKLNNYENKILLNLKKYKIDFICLAGYMKIISNAFVKKYKGKTLLEKPLCEPTNQAIKKLNQLTKSNSDNIYVGYNHVISKANRIVKNIKKNNRSLLGVQYFVFI